jgi:hypothetical protein
MAELCTERAECPAEGLAEGSWAHPGRRKAAAHEARGVQTFAVTSVPAATPIADMVEAMLSGGISVQVVVLAERSAELARGGTDPVGLCKVNGALPVTTIPVSRIHSLLLRIHLLGERPLAELFIQLETGGDLHGMLEEYASFATLADFFRALGCDRLTMPRPINWGRR